MSKILANSKSIIICLFSLGMAVYGQAQNRGIVLKDLCVNCSRFHYDEKNNPVFEPTPEWQIGTEDEEIKAFLIKNKISPEEYSNMAIATCKHKLLRTISYHHIAKGPVFAQNDSGKVQVIYGVVEENGAFNAHIYVFSLDKEGKYIDSIYGSLFGGIFIHDNKIEIHSDGGSCDTEVDDYIVTPQLKFKKIAQ